MRSTRWTDFPVGKRNAKPMTMWCIYIDIYFVHQVLNSWGKRYLRMESFAIESRLRLLSTCQYKVLLYSPPLSVFGHKFNVKCGHPNLIPCQRRVFRRKGDGPLQSLRWGGAWPGPCCLQRQRRRISPTRQNAVPLQIDSKRRQRQHFRPFCASINADWESLVTSYPMWL